MAASDETVNQILGVFDEFLNSKEQVQAMVSALYSRVRGNKSVRMTLRKMMKAVDLPVPKLKKKKGKK